jgi:hypothetical protein
MNTSFIFLNGNMYFSINGICKDNDIKLKEIEDYLKSDNILSRNIIKVDIDGKSHICLNYAYGENLHKKFNL